MQNNSTVDVDLVKLDEWKAILNHPDFNSTVRTFVLKRINDLTNIAKRINREKKGLDGSIEVSHQHSKIEELELLISHFDRKQDQVRQREIAS